MRATAPYFDNRDRDDVWSGGVLDEEDFAGLVDFVSAGASDSFEK